MTHEHIQNINQEIRKGMQGSDTERKPAVNLEVLAVSLVQQVQKNDRAAITHLIEELNTTRMVAAEQVPLENSSDNALFQFGYTRALLDVAKIAQSEQIFPREHD